MNRAIVLRRPPGEPGCAYVPRRHGGYRRITLNGDLGRWLAALGSSVTQPPAVRLAAPQAAPGPDEATPLIPRAGPVLQT